ncbi:MAG TPA: PQQ-dependent sugar dehydrogenase [Gemmatales bacterium]|nr:PQQ-dependent sugar dehydrogenase [Gemmatales bacterium]HMP59199.1 PQQ-dependent sugar dehydrogenase [Gemmatales bacterium]
MMHRSRISLFALLLLLVPAAGAQAQVFSVRVGQGFTNPIFATSAPGDPDRLYVVQQNGQIRLLDPATGTIAPTPFLNLSGIAGTNLISGGERGLLGLAFDPNFTTNGHFYINYTSSTDFAGSTHASGFTRVERYTVDGTGVVDPTSRTPIIGYSQPFSNHNGGWIGFSPHDGYLYIGSGDGGSGNDPQNNGQNRNTLLGKMLRIDVGSDQFPGDPNRFYTIPTTNPFVGVPNVREEIYAYGIRNPWRASFDRLTNDFWIGDVGQGAFEEVNFMLAGLAPGADRNFGWRLREGFDPTPGGVGGPKPADNVDPLFAYSHADGFSITGGYVFRGNLLDNDGAPIDGAYFFADFINGRIWSLRTLDGITHYDHREWTTLLRNAQGGGIINNISSFGEDGYGNLYIVDYDGEIFVLRSTAIPEPASLALLGAAGAAAVVWSSRRRRPAA